MPGLLISQRIGLGGGDLSVSDAALAAAFGTALLLGQRPYSKPLRQLLLINLVYQFATLFTVVVNPYLLNTVEWFHAWMLVSGALIVGWALGAAGYARLALSLIVVTASVFAVITLVQAAIQFAVGDFGPATPTWPFPMHKNFIGTVLAFGAIIVYLNPDWVGWTKGWARLAFVSDGGGNRRGAVAAGAHRTDRGDHHRGAAPEHHGPLPLGALAAHSRGLARRQHGHRAGRVAEPAQFRLPARRVVPRGVPLLARIADLRARPPILVQRPGELPYQPPQAELEVLASAGVVGLIGFLVMWIGVLVVLWRVDPRFGTLAVAVLLCRLVQSQFDLFWTAVQVSVPFVVAGICLGAMEHERRSRDAPDEALQRAPLGRLAPSVRLSAGVDESVSRTGKHERKHVAAVDIPWTNSTACHIVAKP